MAILCGMATIHYSARIARLSVRLCKCAWLKIIMSKLTQTETIYEEVKPKLFANVIAALLTLNACAV